MSNMGNIAYGKVTAIERSVLRGYAIRAWISAAIAVGVLSSSGAAFAEDRTGDGWLGLVIGVAEVLYAMMWWGDRRAIKAGMQTDEFDGLIFARFRQAVAKRKGRLEAKLR